MKKTIISFIFFIVANCWALAQNNTYNADSSRVHNPEALECIKQLLDNKIDSAQFEAISAYIMKWAMASHDVDVNIDEQIGEFMGTPYILGYIAACCEVELQDGVPSLNWQRFIKAMTRLVNFYKLNRDYTGKVERLENYASITNSKIFEKLCVRIFPS